MENSTRHLTWDNFEFIILNPGGKRLHRIPGTPPIDLFHELDAGRVGIRIPVPHETPLPSSLVGLAEITAEFGNVGNTRFLVVAVSSAALYRPFFYFALEVADLIQLERATALDAVARACATWKRLVSESSVLSKEEQLGLTGELWVLARMIGEMGPPAVACWIGPAGEPHDFRVGRFELEVKTTSTAHRVHTFNSLVQLQPSQDHELHILSLMLAPAGDTGTIQLVEQVDSIRKQLSVDVRRKEEFNALLERLGYRDADSDRCLQRWVHRTLPALVPVNSNCPKITPAELVSAPGDLLVRLEDIKYRVNLEGLGFEDGTREFIEVLP